MRELNTIEEKLLDRTLYLIGKSGTMDVPVRAIVKEAGVNLGAINYYFDTKENLMDHVKEYYLDIIESTIAHLVENHRTPLEKLLGYGHDIMAYSLRYPGLQVLARNALEYEEEDPLYKEIVEALARTNRELDQVLKAYLSVDEEAYAIRKIIFFSSLIHPSEEHALGRRYLMQIKDQGKRDVYLKTLLSSIKNG